MVLESLSRPIVAAPMGGGPTTPELVRAVGGVVWCGVNLFVPGTVAEPERYANYV